MVLGMAIRMLGKEVRYLFSSSSPNSYAWVVTSILVVASVSVVVARSRLLFVMGVFSCFFYNHL